MHSAHRRCRFDAVLRQEFIELLHKLRSTLESLQLFRRHWIRIKMHHVVANLTHVFQLSRQGRLINI